MRTILLFLAALGTALATPIGTVNIDNCNGGGVTFTATSATFAGPCIQTGIGTVLQTSFATITPGFSGTIANYTGAPPPALVLMGFAADPNLKFSNIVLGPGSANLNCGNPPCSLTAGSPVILAGLVNTTLILPVSGFVSDATGTSPFVGQISANYAGISPLNLANLYTVTGQLPATTFSGSFTVGNIPEPGTWTLAGIGVLLLAVTRRKT